MHAIKSSFFSRIVAGALIGGLMAVTAFAQTVTVYNSVPKPLPGNVVSEGFECCAVQEFGDGLNLVATGGTIGQVTMVLSSWACQTGNWVSGCVTAPGSTFAQLLTFNLYGVDI